MGQTILYGFRVVVRDETVVLWSPGTRHLLNGLRMNAQINNSSKFGENLSQFLFGGMMRYVTQEQLMIITILVGIAGSAFYNQFKKNLISSYKKTT